MGGIELLGPQRSALRLVNNRAGGAGTNETSLFDGIDTSVPGLAALAGLPAGALQAELAAMDAAAREASRTYDARTPASIVPALARGLTATRAARTAAKGLLAATPDARAEADFLLAFKERDFVEALAAAAGITLDPLANAETVTPGDACRWTCGRFSLDGRHHARDAARHRSGRLDHRRGAAPRRQRRRQPLRPVLPRDADRVHVVPRPGAGRRTADAAVLAGAAAQGRSVRLAGRLAQRRAVCRAAPHGIAAGAGRGRVVQSDAARRVSIRGSRARRDPPQCRSGAGPHRRPRLAPAGRALGRGAAAAHDGGARLESVTSAGERHACRSPPRRAGPPPRRGALHR